MTFIEKAQLMFTLPVDQILSDEYIPAGKKIHPPTWNLTVLIEPGVTKNEKDWCPGQGHTHYSENNIRVEILLGDRCLLDTRLDTKKVMFNKNIEDTRNPQRENLIVRLSGKPEDPDLQDNDHVAIKIDVLIENLSIVPLFEDHGYFVSDSDGQRKIAGDFIGENGQQVIEIYTPIYVWLLQHRHVFRRYAQKAQQIDAL
jgi:hypothetical protein